MLANKLMSALSGGAEDKLYVDDVFSTYLYTGNGATQTINNGIDLAGEGGLVWLKSRGGQSGPHYLFDTERGPAKYLSSNTSEAQTAAFPTYSLTQFNSDGFSLGSLWELENYAGASYASWAFRKAPKFFDVVTYTGNGDHQQVSHSLGVQPGLIIAKAINATSAWSVWHRGATGLYATAISGLSLNATDAPLYNGNMDGSQMRATSFRPSTFYDKDGYSPNANGVQYVAYLFAHDPSADGIIQCGSYTGNGSATGPIVNLGWEPQYLMVKSASGTGNWQIIDSMRGMPVGSADARLQANLPNAESSVDYISPTATGFQVTSTSGDVNTSGSTYIYLAIRRPNKPPTSGTQVFSSPVFSSPSGTKITTDFPVDLGIFRYRVGVNSTYVHDRLRGLNSLTNVGTTHALATNTKAAESGSPNITSTWDNTGFTLDAGYASASNVMWSFRRAPGFFDVVCYTGNAAPNGKFHNLGATPELYIVKTRSVANNWDVFAKQVGSSYYQYLRLNTPEAKFWNTPAPTETAFFVNSEVTGVTYVAYLFASLPGISKVDSYTGNGSSQTINCGFTTGARFILIKRTDSTGDWYIWDTARGIVSSNDPYLSLNTTAAEVTTDDSVDPDVSGFIVNQVDATNINVSGGQYIFLSIA